MKVSSLVKRVAVPFIVVAFLLVGGTPCLAKAKYVFMAQSVYPSPSVSYGSKCFLEWMNRVEKATHGQVKFKKFYGHQLAGIRQSLEALQRGTLDVLYAASYWTGTIPETNFQWLPFSAKGTEHSIHIFRQTLGGRLFREAYRAHGAELLTLIPVSIEGLMCKKPVYKVEDYRGLKLRSGSVVWNDMWKKMGATPVMMSGAEQYTALKQGVIDGTVYPIYAIRTYKFHEVTKYMMMPGIVDPLETMVWMNKDKWDRLPAGIKTIIEDTSIKFEQEYMIPSDVKVTSSVMGFCKKHNVKVIRWKKRDFEELKNIGLGIWDKFSKINPTCREMVESLKADQEWWVANMGEQYRQWEERWLSK